MLLGWDKVIAKSLMDEGMENYNAGRFTLAVSSLSAAMAQEPRNQTLHYYLANALVRLKEHARAVDEYKIAYLLDTKSKIGEYGRQAILAYKKPLPALNDEAFLKVYYLKSDNKEFSASANTPELDKVKNIIRRQANVEKNKHRSFSSHGQRVSKLIAEEQARAVDQKAEYDIQRLYDPIIYNPGPRANPLLADPELLRQKEEAIKKAAAEEKERILRQAEERSETYKTWERHKETALDEVAANLESQLEQPAGRSGVKLQAKGTDLYVRNYIPFSSKTNLLAHPAVVRIVSQDGGNTGQGEPAEEEKADAIVDPRHVHGKVVRH